MSVVGDGGSRSGGQGERAYVDRHEGGHDGAGFALASRPQPLAVHVHRGVRTQAPTQGAAYSKVHSVRVQKGGRWQ